MLEHLYWDSNFFGFKVGRAKGITSLGDLQIRASKDGFDLVYLYSQEPLAQSALKGFDNVLLVDEKVTYVQKIDNWSFKSNSIEESLQRVDGYKLSDELLELAIQSGEYSRFKVDLNIDNHKFRELYKLWITESIANRLADEVWCWTNLGIIQGMITLSKKGNRGNIGLVAVNGSFRGKKIGKSLVTKALEFTSKNRFSELQVVTQKQNFGACKFYESCGFVEEKKEYVYHFWL